MSSSSHFIEVLSSFAVLEREQLNQEKRQKQESGTTGSSNFFCVLWFYFILLFLIQRVQTYFTITLFEGMGAQRVGPVLRVFGAAVQAL